MQNAISGHQNLLVTSLASICQLYSQVHLHHWWPIGVTHWWHTMVAHRVQEDELVPLKTWLSFCSSNDIAALVHDSQELARSCSATKGRPGSDQPWDTNFAHGRGLEMSVYGLKAQHVSTCTISLPLLSRCLGTEKVQETALLTSFWQNRSHNWS